MFFFISVWKSLNSRPSFILCISLTLASLRFMKRLRRKKESTFHLRKLCVSVYVCVCMCTSVCVCACAWKWQREIESVSMCVCVCQSERERARKFDREMVLNSERHHDVRMTVRLTDYFDCLSWALQATNISINIYLWGWFLNQFRCPLCWGRT